MMKKPKKEPLFFVRPGRDKMGKEQTESDLADDVADALIDRINEDRAAKGLPPLPKE